MPSIEVRNISKKYHINKNKGNLLLREKLKMRFENTYKTDRYKADEEFYALENIDFVVNNGQVMGIIGLNGAGKTTLLKILSRITPPTHGQAIINGRVTSLLEVGTGFHPELTGRENIYLNGAILGMNKSEINKVFDKIVDFSGVGRFLDTPVKRYSSGMYVRLAFSVAAYIQPEVLIVDEVLSVGDIEFQKKCLGKMEDIAKNSGKTILFVSHNMNAIQNLCDRCILLEEGKLNYLGNTDVTINKYLKKITQLNNTPLAGRKDRRGNGDLLFTDIELKDANGNSIDCLKSGEAAQIWIRYELKRKINDEINISLAFDTYLENYRVATISNTVIGTRIKPNNKRIIKIFLRDLPFNDGRYYLTIYSDYKNQIFDWVKNAKLIDIKIDKFYNYKNYNPNKGTTLLKYEFIE